MRLPAHLSPWASWLAMFPEPLALGLGDWIARLSPALGSLRRVSRLQPGEPDGYRGLSRRGPYERLVAGEWALADALPDEFLRRAAHGEHLFLELSAADPAGALRSVALFDAGPSQLGSPRIVHIAALIALARRAEAASASFAWGILQQPSGELLESLSPDSLQRLLEARCPTEPGKEHCLAWQERLGRPTEADDRWIVGGPGIQPLAGPEVCRSFVELRDPYELDRTCVLASIRRGADPVREIELELPEPRACAQLLRDPFRAATARTLVDSNRIAAGANLVFSASENRVLARLAVYPGRGVVAYAIPNSPKDQPGKPKTLIAEQDEIITAAGVYRQRLVAVATTAEQLVVYGLGSQDGLGRPRTKISRALAPDFVTSAADGPLQLCLFRRYMRPQGLFLTDAFQHLYLLSLQPTPEAKLVSEQVLTFAALSGRDDDVRFIALQPQPQGLTQVCLRNGAAANEISHSIVDDAHATFVHLGCGDPSHSGQPHLMARRVEWTKWLVQDISQHARPDLAIQVPEGAEVLGVSRSRPGSTEPALILLDPDRKQLRLHGKTGSGVLSHSPSEITAACVGRRTGRVAYCTAAGELVVYSLEHDAVLMRVVLREPEK